MTVLVEFYRSGAGSPLRLDRRATTCLLMRVFGIG